MLTKLRMACPNNVPRKLNNGDQIISFYTIFMQKVAKLIHARTDWENIEEGLKNVNSYHELEDLLSWDFLG